MQLAILIAGKLNILSITCHSDISNKAQKRSYSSVLPKEITIAMIKIMENRCSIENFILKINSNVLNSHFK